MIRTIGNFIVKVLGDQHLGKKFVEGVPLERRGDRERMQREDFTKSLMECKDVNVHVNMGDIFDAWYVSFEVIYWAAETYRRAARANPKTEYYILRGNHDASRDLERISAFRVFAGMFGDVPNINVVADEIVYLSDDYYKDTLAFVPWHPTKTVLEMIDEAADQIECCIATFHHCDVMAITDTSNLLPAKRLKELGVELAVTGHDHLQRDIKMDGLDVWVTGSMQPYSFAEDPDGKLYVTATLEAVKNTLEGDGNAGRLHDYCLRIEMKPGEVIDEPIDCLQLKLIYPDDKDDDGEVEVEFSDFNFNELFLDAMHTESVDPTYAAITRARWEAERAKQ